MTAQPAPMSPDAFFGWARSQQGRWELVGGAPVMMAGASAAHEILVGNVFAALRRRLGRGPCRPYPGNLAVRIPVGNVRYPDVSVDCGPFVPSATELSAPAAVFEILSEGTRSKDRFTKLHEYQSVATIRHVVLIDPDERWIAAFDRQDADGWSSRILGDGDVLLELSALALSVPLDEIYEMPEPAPA